MKVKITRKTRSLGWDFNSAIYAGEQYPDYPKRPVFEGTANQVMEKIRHDEFFKSIRQNTYYTEAWFYKGKRILDSADRLYYALWALLDKMEDEIEVEVAK